MNDVVSNATNLISTIGRNDGSTIKTKFNIYLILQICQIISYIGYVVVGTIFLSSPKELIKTISFHSTFIQLVNNFILLSVPWSISLDHLLTGMIHPSTYTTCIILTYIDSITYYISLFLMAWISFERHLLIFHGKIFNTKRGRILAHYLPLCFILTYVPIYYFAVDFLYKCENHFDYTLFFCGFVCYMNIPGSVLFGVELMIHQVAPTILIALFSSTLFIRVVFQRRRLQQAIEWNKYRKMILQLFGTSMVYMVFATPWSINPIVEAAHLPPVFTYDAYANFLTYWTMGIPCMVPFVIAFSMPKLNPKFRAILPFGSTRRARNTAVAQAPGVK